VLLCYYSFRQNVRTIQADTHTDTAWLHRSRLHSIAWQKLTAASNACGVWQNCDRSLMTVACTVAWHQHCHRLSRYKQEPLMRGLALVYATGNAEKNTQKWKHICLPRDAMQARPMPSCGVFLSFIRLPRSYILSKQINISSKFVHHRVATPL